LLQATRCVRWGWACDTYVSTALLLCRTWQLCPCRAGRHTRQWMPAPCNTAQCDTKVPLTAPPADAGAPARNNRCAV
jgi:hypothetical protein